MERRNFVKLLAPLAAAFGFKGLSPQEVNADLVTTPAESVNQLTFRPDTSQLGQCLSINPFQIRNQFNDEYRPYTISFYKDNKVIGAFDISGQKMKFVGDADESVKIFVDCLNNLFEERLKCEYERGRYDYCMYHGLNDA